MVEMEKAPTGDGWGCIGLNGEDSVCWAVIAKRLLLLIIRNRSASLSE